MFNALLTRIVQISVDRYHFKQSSTWQQPKVAFPSDLLYILLIVTCMALFSATHRNHSLSLMSSEEFFFFLPYHKLLSALIQKQLHSSFSLSQTKKQIGPCRQTVFIQTCHFLDRAWALCCWSTQRRHSLELHCKSCHCIVCCTFCQHQIHFQLQGTYRSKNNIAFCCCLWYMLTIVINACTSNVFNNNLLLKMARTMSRSLHKCKVSAEAHRKPLMHLHIYV